MTLRRTFLCAALAGLCWLAPGRSLANDEATANPDAPSAATVLNMEGTVQVQDDQAWRTLEDGEPLENGDRVRTGENSTLHLLLADGSSLVLGPNSEATLDSLGTGAEGSQTLIGLVHGLVNAMVEHLKAGSRFEVSTQDAVAAVKGTDFEVSVGVDLGSQVTVNNGVVQLGDRQGQHFAPVAPGERRAFFHGRLGEARRLRAEDLRAFQGRWARAHAWHQERLHRFQGLRPVMRAQRRHFLKRLERRRAWHRRMDRAHGRPVAKLAPKRALRKEPRAKHPVRHGQDKDKRPDEKRRLEPPKHEN